MTEENRYLELECRGCHTEFEAREDNVPFFCPVCGNKVDCDCWIYDEREENKDVVVETFKKVAEDKKKLAESTYVSAQQLGIKDEMYVTTHYLHISRHILSDELPYEPARNLYSTMLDNPACGGVVFGKMAPIEVMDCELSAEIVKMCVMRDKVVIFDPSQSFELDSGYWDGEKESF